MVVACPRPALVGALGALLLASATGCGGDRHEAASRPPPSAAQLAEARRLIDPDHVKGKDPTDAEIGCIARVIVQDPTVDAIANDMAQVTDKDLRELVMTNYLRCAYNFVLDVYMRFAPAGLGAGELKCIRSKFSELEVKRLSEVIVQDPDAGYTGPLVIQSCKSGSATNPLESGTIPSMGGS